MAVPSRRDRPGSPCPRDDRLGTRKLRANRLEATSSDAAGQRARSDKPTHSTKATA